MVGPAEIAVVSFKRFINGDTADKRAVAKKLYEAFSTAGWTYLKDHGILQERVDEIFALVRPLYTLLSTFSDSTKAKTFFELPI